jgi:hypothetical protein
MRFNNHPSDGSVLGCGDFDLMLEDGNTELNSTSQFSSLQNSNYIKKFSTGISDSTLRH